MQDEALSRLLTFAIVLTFAIEPPLLLQPCPWEDGHGWDCDHCHSIGLEKHQHGGDADGDVEADVDAVSLHSIQKSGQDWAG